MIKNEVLSEQNIEKEIVVDLNNILLEDKNEDGNAKICNIEKIETCLKSSGYIKILFIAGAQLRHNVDDKKYYSKILKEKKIYQAPAKIDTDWYILSYAKANNCYILSNDKFDEYKEKFGALWLKEKRKTFMLIEGQLFIQF